MWRRGKGGYGAEEVYFGATVHMAIVLLCASLLNNVEIQSSYIKEIPND